MHKIWFFKSKNQILFTKCHHIFFLGSSANYDYKFKKKVSVIEASNSKTLEYRLILLT